MIVQYKSGAFTQNQFYCGMTLASSWVGIGVIVELRAMALTIGLNARSLINRLYNRSKDIKFNPRSIISKVRTE